MTSVAPAAAADDAMDVDGGPSHESAAAPSSLLPGDSAMASSSAEGGDASLPAPPPPPPPAVPRGADASDSSDGSGDEDDNAAEDDGDGEDDDEDDDKAKTKGTKGGSSCHQCKSRRNEVALTYCTSTLDRKNKRCRKKFCGHCLKKFYKENPSAIADKSAWKCPSCRKICCCAACRRRKQKDINGALGKDDSASKQRKNKDVHSLYPLSDDPLLAGHDYRSDVLGHEFDSPSHRHHHSHHHSHHSAPGGDGADLSLHSAHALDSSFLSQPSHAEPESAYNSDEDAAAALPASLQQPAAISSPDFSSVLASHIALLADESVRLEGATAFGRLYAAARNATNSRRIGAVLQRTDISKERKVDMIANLLVAID